MTESPTDLIRKSQLDMLTSLTTGIVGHHSSPILSADQESRLSRLSYSVPITQGRKIFGYEIFVDNDVLQQLQPQLDWLDKIKKAGEVESIKFNLDLNIPDLNGRNIQIYDKEMQRKYQSCRALLADIYQVFKKIRREHFSIIIFVPEGMVSLLIGTKGYQINKIMRQSHTTIVVNQPINKMTYRTVKIQGYHSDIAKACRIIYEILEDKSSIAYSIEKEPSQLDYSKARVKTKFILCSTILNYLLSKKKAFLKKIEDETKCVVKFKEDSSSRSLKKQQQLCVLLGKLQDVQAFLVMLINLIQLYYEQDRKGHDYTFKMLIPSNYVTKLIGQKGYMIRDITQRSGGAQIKILSDRQAQRDARECIISINGTRQNKIDATCLILQQIECFKNGGPILQSGKSINENLAQQFKNSLPLHKENELGDEPQHSESAQPESFLPTSQKKQLQNIRPSMVPQVDNNSEEGLISPEEGEQMINEQLPKENDETPDNNLAVVNLPKTTYVKQASPQPELPKAQQVRSQDKKIMTRSPSRRSEASHSSSPSRSRKKSRRGEGKDRSSSSSFYQQDKEYVQMKMLVPRKLAQDHRQLKYIESRCRSEIALRDQVPVLLAQRVENSGEAVISIKGSLKDNMHCIRMLSKRILRLTVHSSTR